MKTTMAESELGLAEIHLSRALRETTDSGYKTAEAAIATAYATVALLKLFKEFTDAVLVERHLYETNEDVLVVRTTGGSNEDA